MTKAGRNGSTPLNRCCSHKVLIHEVMREFSAPVLTGLNPCSHYIRIEFPGSNMQQRLSAGTNVKSK